MTLNLKTSEVLAYFTWLKSPLKPTTSIMKKLGRIMVNEEFMKSYPTAFGHFLTFMTSDHSYTVLIIPKCVPKNLKAFRFANYITDKAEFITMVKEG